MIFAAVTSMFVHGQFEGTPIADYRFGALINVPTFTTQPYYLTAQTGCPIVDRPVCGVDGKTYQNECFIKLGGIAKAYDGWCIGYNAQSPSANAEPKDPLAETEETGFLRFGTPTSSSCPCNDAFYPVCTDKGITYGNLCRAKCNGAKGVQVGSCYNFYYKPVKDVLCKCSFVQELICSTDNVTY